MEEVVKEEKKQEKVVEEQEEKVGEEEMIFLFRIFPLGGLLQKKPKSLKEKRK